MHSLDTLSQLFSTLFLFKSENILFLSIDEMDTGCIILCLLHLFFIICHSLCESDVSSDYING